MKKKLIIFAAACIALLCIYIIGSGFVKSSSAYISDFTVSEDGTEMTINISVASSAGYVRKVAPHGEQNGRLYLDCYSAFGGSNGSIGAKGEYTVQLNEDTDTIALYRNTDCYEEVLKKDDSGSWQRV